MTAIPIYRIVTAVAIMLFLVHPAAGHRGSEDSNGGDRSLVRLVNQSVYLELLEVRKNHSDNSAVEEDATIEFDTPYLRYCIQANVRHRSHPESDSVTLLCGKANWDRDKDKWGPNRILLVGDAGTHPEGLFSSRLLLTQHFGECTAIDQWEVDVRLFQLTKAKYITGALDKVNWALLHDRVTEPHDLYFPQELEPLQFKGAAARILQKGFGAALALPGDHGVKHVSFGSHRYVFEKGSYDSGFSDNKRSDEFKSNVYGPIKDIGQCPARKLPEPPKETREISDDGEVCFREPGNPLCSNYGPVLKRQFGNLRKAAKTVEAEPQEGGSRESQSDISDEQKKFLIDWIGSIAAESAKRQLEVAKTNDKICCKELLERMTAVLESATALLGEATAGDASANLQEAISRYETVNLVLAPLNYGDEFEAGWQQSMSEYFRESIFDVLSWSRQRAPNAWAEPEAFRTIDPLLRRFDSLSSPDRKRISAEIEAEFSVNLTAGARRDYDSAAHQERLFEFAHQFLN